MWSGRLVLLIGIWGASHRTMACSHLFDNNVFPLDDRQLLAVKTGDFHRELARLGFVQAAKPVKTGDPVEIECAELAEAQGHTELSAEEQLRALDEFRVLRQWMAWARDRASGLGQKPGEVWPREIQRSVPENLPAEFTLYLRGAMAYNDEDFEVARKWWKKLLALPVEQRRYRTVWATYMIGRSYLGQDAADARAAVHWMARVPPLAKAGFADSMGLSQAARGWEALGHLRCGQIERAIRIYFELGDELSLADAAQEAFKAPPHVLDRLAGDPLCRGVLTACVVSRGGPWRPEIHELRVDAWLAALEKTGAVEIDLADRIAWAAYEHGRVETAARWLARAKTNSTWAMWLRSKFLLREGKLEEAAVIMSTLINLWPVNEEWNAHWESPVNPADHLVGELSMITMQRGRYVEAMDLLLRSGFFDESAHIAERVLNCDELKQYVDQNWNESTPPMLARERGQYSKINTNPQVVWREIRYLLARRLTRLGRYWEASPYFPLEKQQKLSQMVTWLDTSRDPTLSKDERGEALWEAAKVVRYHGMELMGTQLGPDWFSTGGNSGNWRVQEELPARAPADSDNPLTGPTLDERERVLASRLAPEKRFRYRYIAADWAWQAAAMLPDESDLKARVLCEGGYWLANREPESADKFYRALVRDCGTTKLGRQARALRWFP